MIFSSSIFLYMFLPIILLVYYVIRNRKGRNAVLLIGSLVFYAWGEPIFVFVMMVSIIVNYTAGRMIAHNRGQGHHIDKFVFILTMFFNLGMLVIFKYLGFFVINTNRLLHTSVTVPDISLPIGISFFTFQSISYVADVYTGKVKAQRNLYKLALYIAFFPQLIAGPIVRYTDIETAIDNRKESLEDFSEGIKRFVIGLAKKVLLADQLAVLADSIFDSGALLDGLFSNMTVTSAWIGAIAYTLQIYFDFSGYSDMAIGLGRMFGFKFPENFHSPYAASSIRDFWKRWHISLSSWFRDYVYIPLGGSRGTTLLTIRNLCIVWLLTGLWHGASWNFVLWGGIYLILLLLERFVFPMDKVMKKPVGALLYRIFTLICISSAWVVFRLTSIQEGICYIRSMFGINASEIYESYDGFLLLNNAVLFITAGLGCLPWRQWKERFMAGNHCGDHAILCSVGRILKAIALICLMILSMASIARGNYSPFIYFNF